MGAVIESRLLDSVLLPVMQGRIERAMSSPRLRLG